MIVKFYLCPRCFTPAEKSAPCSNCGSELVRCRPGTIDDPSRKPLATKGGELRSRAPVWWLRAIGAPVRG